MRLVAKLSRVLASSVVFLGCAANDDPARAPEPPLPSAPSAAAERDHASPRARSSGNVDFHLVWHDEFDDGAGLEQWWREVKPPGWRNQELQAYTDRPENARIENGLLVIEARNDKYGPTGISSAYLRSRRSFTYGRFEARIKLSRGRGTWPTFWMLPEQKVRGWPADGEICILEHVGYMPDKISATFSTAKYNWVDNTVKYRLFGVPGAATTFHDYALDWRPDALVWYVDGVEVYRFVNERTPDTWPFEAPFYLILNIAVGGNYGGKQGIDAAAFPHRMEVDWVRVYTLAATDAGAD